MQAIGRLVQQHSPDVIFFQEVTPQIYRIFQRFTWWGSYHCSPVSPEEQATKRDFCLLLSKLPLENFSRWTFSVSPAGRHYLEADISPGQPMKQIHVATRHLESPIVPMAMRCMERFLEAGHAVAALNNAENVVFGGDMSWDEDFDGPFPLPVEHAWSALWLGTPWSVSYAYDGMWEQALRASRRVDDKTFLLKRSDMMVSKLRDYRMKSIEVVGRGGIGLYRDDGDGEGEGTWFFPSYHYGLVLTLVADEAAELEREQEQEDGEW